MAAISLTKPASYGEGVLMICIFLSSSLYGLTSFQGISYFRNFTSDPKPLKIMVASVMTLSTFHVCLCWFFMYHYFIVGFGDYVSLLIPPWAVKLTIPITCVAECICHLFFVTRIWTLSNKNKVLCGMIVLMELAHVGSIAAFTVKCFQATYFTELTGIPENKRLVTACLSASLCSDVVITFSMCYYLHSSRTGYKKTDTLLMTLILYSINTGIITAVGDAIVMAMFLGFPDNVAFFAIFEITIELYANAILTSLNTRTTLGSIYIAREQKALWVSESICYIFRCRGKRRAYFSCQCLNESQSFRDLRDLTANKDGSNKSRAESDIYGPLVWWVVECLMDGIKFCTIGTMLFVARTRETDFRRTYQLRTMPTTP
ncbi:hypothetical protein SISSUDRAFT_1119112 [Sistotremastrum suecicum HHB10207 ss-3]|uniref:DUF6534 domain-containing protein n=1 Tax=Sistotremastrum suecicum HHB10207 ss-3 TaxID=1314776 RepID=A0A166E2W6_9AGAM|nr:hypothetical protein SISSUDRAFT_1119112 [Sistotremastrum suecicum HHB10207 ss-3]